MNLDELFKHEDIRKVHKDSTVTLHGVLYEVDSILIGEHVHLRYDVSIPPLRRRVEVVLDGKSRTDARIVDTYANSRVRRAFNSDQVVVEPQPRQSSPPPTTSVSASLAASRLLHSSKEQRS